MSPRPKVSAIVTRGGESPSGQRYVSMPTWGGASARHFENADTDRLNQAHWQLADDASVNTWLLAQLPTLRSPAVMRPAQIIFCAIDIDASTSERDGYDICGLMLGNVERAGEPRYLFAVGVVARSDYRPAAIADVRLVAISPRQGTLSWQVGGADPQALDRYRRRFSPTAVPRFPALEDRFSIAPCGAGVCATELVSGARWALQF